VRKNTSRTQRSLPQALKRLHIFDGLAARLKSGPPQNLPESHFFRSLLMQNANDRRRTADDGFRRRQVKRNL
jgi:hypothetical protein